MYDSPENKDAWVIVSRGIPIDLKPQLQKIVKENELDEAWANSFFFMTVLVPRYHAVQTVLGGKKPSILATITMPENADEIPQPIRDFLASENIHPVPITEAENESIERSFLDMIEPFFHGHPEASLQNYNEQHIINYRNVSQRFQAALKAFPEDVITSHSDPYLLLVAPRSTVSHDVYNINIPSAHAWGARKILNSNKDLHHFFKDIYANLNTYKSVLFLAKVWAENHRTMLQSIGEPVKKNIGLISGGCVSEYTELLENESIQHECALLHQQYDGFHPILSVDRIDPYKGGFIQRVDAFEQALDDGSFRRSRPIYLMALKLKEDEERHDHFRNYKYKILDRINLLNDKLGKTLGYQPIVVLPNQTRPQLSALYKFLAEKKGVFVVTPKEEGSHRGAWEACSVATKVKSSITLMISFRAGAQYWLKGAIKTNPFCTGKMSSDFREAVRMSTEEQDMRHQMNVKSVDLLGDTVENFSKAYMMILLTHRLKIPLHYSQFDWSSPRV